MGILLIVTYYFFISITVILFSLIFQKVEKKRTKIFVNFLMVFVCASPILFLFARDLLIAKELDAYCKKNNSAVVVKSIDNNLVEFSTGTGESRDLWEALYRNIGMKLIINIDRSRFITSPGQYVFTAMVANSPECISYYNYIDKQSETMRKNINRYFVPFSDYCVGVYEYRKIEGESLLLDYKRQYSNIKKNPFYSLKEERLSLVDKISKQEFIYSNSPFVHRSFTLFEFSTLFKFSNSCPPEQSEYQLLSMLYSSQGKKI